MKGRTQRKLTVDRLFVLAVTSLAMACSSERAGTLDANRQGAGEEEGRLALRAVILVPGNPLAAYDISWVDQDSQTYFLADRSNAGVDIFNARNNTFVVRVPGFVGADPRGNDFSGPNGVLEISSQREVWAGDGPSGQPPTSSVKVIDLTANPPRIIDSINTRGERRSDEMAYDPDDHILAVVNNADEPPFVTLISTQPPRRVLHQFIFNAALGAPFGVSAFSGGLEQPAWNPHTQLFYVSVPELNHDASLGAVAVLNPRTHQLVNLFRVRDCSPAGLTLGPRQRLLIGCSDPSRTVVMKATNGRIVREILEVGGSDEVWFNPGDGNYYLAARDNPGGPVLGVIDAESNRFVTSVRTALNSHSVAVNEHNNHIFVPLTRPRPGHPEDPNPCVDFGGPQFAGRGCVGVYWRSDEDEHGGE